MYSRPITQTEDLIEEIKKGKVFSHQHERNPAIHQIGYPLSLYEESLLNNIPGISQFTVVSEFFSAPEALKLTFKTEKEAREFHINHTFSRSYFSTNLLDNNIVVLAPTQVDFSGNKNRRDMPFYTVSDVIKNLSAVYQTRTNVVNQGVDQTEPSFNCSRNGQEPVLSDTDIPGIIPNAFMSATKADVPKIKKPKIKTKAELSIEEIDAALNILKSKIGSEKQHKYAKAVDAANVLLFSLQSACDAYKDVVTKNSSGNEQAAAKQFYVKATAAINDSKRVLEKDLGWSDYLKNLGKILLNAVAWAFTLGKVNSLFTVKKPNSHKAVEAEEHHFTGLKA